MSILSITFHSTPGALEEWEKYTAETLTQMAENLMDVERYVLSEVDTETLSEGKNFNLLLFFESDAVRQQFLESEFENIRERVEDRFGPEVIVFPTLLNPRKTRF